MHRRQAVNDRLGRVVGGVANRSGGNIDSLEWHVVQVAEQRHVGSASRRLNVAEHNLAIASVYAVVEDNRVSRHVAVHNDYQPSLGLRRTLKLLAKDQGLAADLRDADDVGIDMEANLYCG
jgi:hypothetical protein